MNTDSADIVTIIFVLSSISPGKMLTALKNIAIVSFISFNYFEHCNTLVL